MKKGAYTLLVTPFLSDYSLDEEGLRLLVKRQVDTGAYGCQISGGGSSVVTLYSHNNIDEIADIMQHGFNNNPYLIMVYKTTTSNQGVQII